MSKQTRCYSANATLVFIVLLSGLVAIGEEPRLTPLFDSNTPLEPATRIETSEALVTRIGDRVRDRHARESEFQAYNHYLSFYWEQRSVSLEFIDRIAKGGDEIVINIESQTPLNEPNFRSFFRGLTTVAEYHENVIATEVGTNQYSLTLTQNVREGRPLQIGDKIEFEFSPFLAAPKNGRSNYYGTTMLYVVGEGIVPWMGVGSRLDSVPLSKGALIGGMTTLPYQYSNEPAERFKQMAGNISPTSVPLFLLGRRLHHTNMLDGTHSEQPNPVFSKYAGKLGPEYVARSCISCHTNNGRALPPAVGAPMYQTVIKVATDANGTPHPELGTAVQPRSTQGQPEATASIAKYESIQGSYADGTPFELRYPVYSFQGPTPKFYSVRLTPQLVGLGLLEAIRESDILALADPEDRDGDGISGRPQIVREEETGRLRLGRFGFKAGQPRLRDQVAAALSSDMGVTTAKTLSTEQLASDTPAEMSAEDLDRLARYVALLGVNARRNFEDEEANRGQRLFAEAGCAACHTESFTTSPHHPFAELRSQKIQPFTDLLLHDMGDGLADSLGEHEATGKEWRTAPLWGLGLTDGVSHGVAFLHDGRARNLAEAILWHGGEAENAREAFRNMPQGDRNALIEFLESL